MDIETATRSRRGSESASRSAGRRQLGRKSKITWYLILAVIVTLYFYPPDFTFPQAFLFGVQENLIVSYDPRQTLKVGTFNIRTGRDCWRKFDLSRTARIIKDLDVDIIGLQEVDNKTERSRLLDEPKALSRMSGMPYYYYLKLFDHDSGEYGIALLSKHKILQTQTFLYSNPSACNDTAMRKRTDDPCRGIIASEVQFTQTHSVWFVTTHFSLLADAQETESSELLEFVHSLIPNFTAPFNTIVLAGDFNVPPHAPVLQKIQNNNLWPVHNVWETCGSKVRHEGFTFPADYPNTTLDHLFIHGWPTVQTMPKIVARDEEGKLVKRTCVARVVETTTSDHRPYMAYFHIAEGTQA